MCIARFSPFHKGETKGEKVMLNVTKVSKCQGQDSNPDTVTELSAESASLHIGYMRLCDAED